MEIKPYKHISLLPIFENVKQETLIIVDVQKHYEKYWVKNNKPNLVQDIANFAATFPTVIQIYDTNKQGVQDFSFPNTTKVFSKQYGGKYEHNVTGLHYDNDRYVLKVEGGTHDWFFPSIELVDCLKNIPNHIVLVGGAYGECLYDVQFLLQILGKQFTVNKNLTYHA